MGFPRHGYGGGSKKTASFLGGFFYESINEQIQELTKADRQR